MNIFQKFITKIKNHKIRKQIRKQKREHNFMENLMLCLNGYIKPNMKQHISIRNNFLLFHYRKNLLFTSENLGDYFQTLATKNALLSLNPKATFEYFDRDSLISYYPAGGGGK